MSGINTVDMAAEGQDAAWADMMKRGQAMLSDLSPTMIKALSDLSADRDSTWVKDVTWQALERRRLIQSAKRAWKGLTEDGSLVVTRLAVLEREQAESEVAAWEATQVERKREAQRAADAFYAVATDPDPVVSSWESGPFVTAKRALIAAIQDAYGASSGTAEEIYRLMNDGDFIVSDAVAVWDARREEQAAEDQQATWEAITAGERGDAEKTFDVENAAGEWSTVLDEGMAEMAAMDAAAQRAEVLLGRYRESVCGSDSAARIAMDLDAAVESAYPDVEINSLISFLATHDGYSVKQAVEAVRARDAQMTYGDLDPTLTAQQRAIRVYARKLAQALESVPASTVHYAVANGLAATEMLIRLAGGIVTADAKD